MNNPKKKYGNNPSYDSATNPDIDPAVFPKYDPAKNKDGQDSLNDSLGDNKSNKYSDEGKEDEDDKKRAEVLQEFSLGFEKKIAKYIPPKIKFEGDIRKKTIVNQKNLDDNYASSLKMFKNYFIYYTTNSLKILNKDLKLVFSEKIIQDDNEIFDFTIINDETIALVVSDKVRIMHLKEEKIDQFTYEIIQEIKDTELFYCLGGILNNGYLLLEVEIDNIVL